MNDRRVGDKVMGFTGLSSGRFVKGSPVISSNPGALGLLYDMLYTLPEGRWTYLSEIRARMTWSGTSRLTIKVNGVDFVLRSSQMPVRREKGDGMPTANDHSMTFPVGESLENRQGSTAVILS